MKTYCWCGSEIDDKGVHLDIPNDNNPWANSHMIKDEDGNVTHKKKDR